MNYYRRYVGDYIRDTARLSMIEHGAYNLMLDYYYADERPLPLDHEEVYRMIRALKPEERKAVDRVLDLYFESRADGYHNARGDDEISRAAPFIEAARENGKRGGRRKNPPDNPVGPEADNPSGSRNGTHAEPNGISTGQATRAGDPSSNHQPPLPTPTHQPPTPTQDQPLSPGASPAVARKRRGNSQDENPKTASTWDAYSEAYQQRYGQTPVRNATVNAQLAQVVKRLGVDEAPKVAAFYVTSSRGLYASAKHAVNLLLRDCEGLRTEWANGRAGTDTEARQADRTAATVGVFEKLIAETGT